MFGHTSLTGLASVEMIDHTPSKPALELVRGGDQSALIKRSDARDLLSYFGLGGTSGAFGASPLAGQLAQQSLYAFHARPCVRCGGDKKKGVGGGGFVCSSKKGREQSEKQRLTLEAMGIVLPPGAADRVCPDCNGRGWVCPKRPSRSTEPDHFAPPRRKGQKKAPERRAITARPTGSSKHGSGPSASVNDADMATLGIMGKRLEAVRAVHPPCAEAIQAWFGTEKSDGGQSVRALWHLTDAGQAMLDRNSLGVPASEFFDNERADQAAHPNANRRISFQAADKQATKLWASACQLFNSTAPVKKAVVRLDAAPGSTEPAAAPETDPVAAE